MTTEEYVDWKLWMAEKTWLYGLFGHGEAWGSEFGKSRFW